MHKLRTVAHCITPYLVQTTNWVYTQIKYLKRYRPVILTQATCNLQEFPVDSIYSAENYTRQKQVINRIIRKTTGSYPFYTSMLSREKAGLIHAHFGQEGYRCLKAKKKAQLPMVTTFYGLDASQLAKISRWRKCFKKLFEEGDLFLAEGTCLRQRLIELGCPPEKVLVHHLGVETDHIQFLPRPSNLKSQTYSFLICASFREKKGIIFAIEAFAMIAKNFPQARLTIIGDGPLRGQIEEAIRRHDIGSRVRLLGYLPHAQFWEHTKSADIFLQPSVTASDGDTEGGAPVVLIEAQAAGMPVIATYHADIPEVVLDGESGYLVPEKDVEALTERIDRLLSHPESWAEMGQKGRRHVEMNYNATIQAEKLENIYDHLIK